MTRRSERRRGRELPELPVDGVLAELVHELRTARGAVLVAETGSGKTTRAAPALMELLEPGETCWLIQPRRLAARAAARRIALERGCEVGEDVGYSVRFDRRVSERTRLVCVTPGVFLRRMTEDPLADGLGAVVFDELHERSLELDLCLALARRVQASVRPDLCLLAMSATIDPAPVASFLGGAPVVRASGRSHPVEVLREPRRAREPLEDAVLRALESRARRPDGDVLVFLPGVGEIRRVGESVRGFASAAGYELFELYGDLPPERQDAVFRRGERPKLVLATNLAESSVTLPDVTLVVDSGLERRLVHDPASELARLELARCSLASAEQRRGRAGRVRSGRCVRLWSEPEERSMPSEIEPEVQRLDPTASVLRLLAFGEPDPSAFPWFEAPAEARLRAAVERLEAWGAARGGRPTELGRALLALPLDPRLGRLALAGRARGVPRRAALACALLSERDPFRGSAFPDDDASSDLLDRVQAIERGRLSRAAVGRVERAARRIEADLRDLPGVTPEATDPDEAFLRASFEAFADRLARRREPGSPRAVLRGGTGCELARTSRVRRAELFVAIDLDTGRGGDALCRMASAVERGWLDEEGYREEQRVRFDGTRERVALERLLTWRGLVLERREDGGLDPEQASAALVEAAAEDLARAFDLDAPELAAFLARVAWLAAERPELELPRLVPDVLTSLLPSLASGTRSFAELRKLDLVPWLSSALTSEQRAALEREAPERLEVPSGSRIRLTYEPGRPPVLAARIQELFGLAETPRVAGGRVPVLVHLLAPNGRPQQVTSDLASFWNDAYHVVRKELARRYPRHAWPNDPWNAKPECRPGRRRSR